MFIHRSLTIQGKGRQEMSTVSWEVSTVSCGQSVSHMKWPLPSSWRPAGSGRSIKVIGLKESALLLWILPSLSHLPCLPITIHHHPHHPNLGGSGLRGQKVVSCLQGRSYRHLKHCGSWSLEEGGVELKFEIKASRKSGLNDEPCSYNYGIHSICN